MGVNPQAGCRSLLDCRIRGRSLYSSLLAALALAVALSAPAHTEQAAGPVLAFRTGDPALDSIQGRLLPTLEANHKELRGSTGLVRGFGAGDRYPQIWLRDSATLVPLARYLYPREELVSWIEEHLASQAADGALQDWIAAGEAAHFREWAPQARDLPRDGDVVLSADTNTTEADQEASAVEAAYQAWRATGDDAWLRKAVAGRALIERLGDALRHVLVSRWDPRRGLVTNALTADWGDVSPTYPDQRAIYQDERTPLAVGLYTNAMVLRACLRLTEMSAVAGDRVRASYFRTRAAAIRSALDGVLWQPSTGFYRMHLPTTPERAPGFPDDRDVFAMGGHAVALLSGVGSDAQVARILAAASARQARFGLSTVSAALLPPYADGVFLHPTMAREWRYQNGGQWDWFGARLVLAAFERGHSAWARARLVEIARRIQSAGGLYEWYDRQGRGQGSPRYAGSAGALGDAVIHGLFGVDLARGRLDLRLRLGGPGRISLRQPATSTRIETELVAEAGRMQVSVDSNVAGTGRLAVLLPEGRAPTGASLDGRPVAVTVETAGEDRFAVIETDWASHRLELRLGPAGPGIATSRSR